MKDKVSVIIPVYNVEKYLNRCIQSVVDQTYKNLEIILVDDGSPDNCPQMCDEWKKKDERIKVIHKKNGGVSSARNEGLKIATGEFVQFVDSDDYLGATFCEELVNAYKEDVDLVISGFTMVDFKNRKIENKMPYSDVTSIRQDINQFFEFLHAGMLYPPVTKLFRKKLIDTCFPQGVALGEDRIFVLEYLQASKNKIIVIENADYMYVQNIHSATHKKRDDILDVYSNFLDKLTNFLDKLFKTHNNNKYYKCIFDVIEDSVLKSSKENLRNLKEQIFNHPFFIELKNHYKPEGIKEKIKFFLIKHKMFKTLRVMSKIKNIQKG